MVSIQPVVWDDKKAVVTLFNKEKDIWPWGGGVIFWRFFNNRGRTEQWIKAVIDDKVVGFAHFAMKADNTRTLYDIIVDPEVRGQGVGRALISAIGAPILLKTDSEAASNGFYQKLGFVRGDTLPTRDGKKFTTTYYLERKHIPMAATTRLITYTGRHLDLLDIKPEDIDIHDIAHGLACCNRFAGQAVKPISVAQHSVYVSRLCQGSGQELKGLLHDASEAYLGDVTYYLKRSDQMAGYRELEERVQKAIYSKFGCLLEDSAEVKAADILMVRYEGEEAFGKAWQPLDSATYRNTTEEEREQIGKWAPWPWRAAEEAFLVRYRYLTKQTISG